MDNVKLALAMDKMQPDWWLTFADETDMRDALRMLYDQRSGVDRFRAAQEMLRSRVSRKLFEVCRAAVHNGLLQETSK